ncbi:MAG: patatin-like phospholipase family protein [Anaerolineae bacterium]|nr:patatin-like phospholipase family protein [Anaerolineae bacterium]
MSHPLLSREELLSGGLNRSRRAAKLLSAIEARCLYMRAESQRVVTAYLLTSDEGYERSFDVHFAESLKLVAAADERLLPEHLERFASQWKSLLPPDPELRARVLRLIEQKYGLSPAVLAALGAGEQATQAAYHHLYDASLDAASCPPHAAAPPAEAAGNAQADIEAQLEWLRLASGETLYQAGDPGDALYVVISGRLRATALDEAGFEQFAGEMGRGELLGELEVLTGDVRGTTVQAIRDSELVCLSRKGLLALAHKNLQVMVQINALIARRLHQQYASPGPAVNTFLTYVLLPCDAGVPLPEFGRQLAAALRQIGPTAYLTAGTLDEAIEPGAAQAAPGDPRDAQIVSWLSDVESGNRYVVYEAAPDTSEWSQRCVRQADRIVLVARAGASPLPAPHETALLAAGTPALCGRAGESPSHVDLVVLHGPAATSAAGIAQWLAPRCLRAHHHVRAGNSDDVKRLARRLTGHAFGLVLGGGGARGFGHIGVLRALREAGVTVDDIGGTSMGALIAAGFAMGMDDVQLKELGLRIGSRQTLLDRTLPIVSLYATRKITELIRQLSGELNVEDLWMPYFCISSNLSRGEQMVHTRGPLWQAVRASMAAAPIFTPILYDGDLLVDGGFLNNVPVDVMRQRVGSGTVLGIDCSPISAKARPYDFGPSVSAWEALRYQIVPAQRQKGPPNIAGVFSQIMDTNGLYRQQFTKDAADVILRLPTREYGMLDFEYSAEIIELGYRATCDQMADWLPLHQKG